MAAPTAQEFERIYNAIHACRKCAPGVVPSCVPRQTDEAACRSGIVLMAQAPSEHGVRESGVHWVGADRRLRRGGGEFIEGYLRQIGYSVDPGSAGYRRPYTTNVLHCWTGPGRKPGKHRDPSDDELESCKPWWLEELALVRPRVIILLGAPAAKSFAYVCGDRLLGELATKPFASTYRNPRLFRRLLSSQGDDVEFGNLLVRRYVVPHPANWQYRGRAEIYQQVIELVREVLKHE